MTSTTYMLWAGGGGAVALLGLALAVYGLFWDRARGRKRCPSCGYSMEGLTGLTCPECGKGARTERALLRTRRRWRTALVGVLAIPIGLGGAAWPIVRAKDPWPLLPHGVLGWFVPRHECFDVRQQGRLLAAFVKPTLTRAEYERVIRRQSELLRQPSASNFLGLLVYRLGTPRANPDGTFSLTGTGPEFVWHVTDQQWNPYSALSASTAVALADGLAYHWRQDPTFRGYMSARELNLLAYWHPAAADRAMAFFFDEPVAWIAYAIDPRAKHGDVFNLYLQAFRGPDRAHSERAAAALQKSYFDVKAHWRSIPADLKWIWNEYPSYEELKTVSARAGDELLTVALEGSGEPQRLAVLALVEEPVMWQPQVVTLLHNAQVLPDDLAAILRTRRPTSGR